jgi:hypothetical protein
MRGGVGVGFPVPYLTPTTTDRTIAFDIFPKGNPSDSSSEGTVWIDLVSTDFISDTTNWEVLRVGKLKAGYAHIGASKSGSGTVRNLHMQQYGGKLSVGTIGSTEPDTLLHVYGGTAGAVSAYTGAIATFENSDNTWVQILAPDGKYAGIIFGSPSGTNNAFNIFYTQSAGQLCFSFSGGQVVKMGANTLGFFGANPVAQQTKANHNNWAAVSDVVSALVNLGFIDAA